MKKITVLAILAIISAAGFAELAVSSASFDTQLNQAKAEIARIAAAGLFRQQSSFDTQLNQAKRAIAEIAEQGK